MGGLSVNRHYLIAAISASLATISNLLAGQGLVADPVFSFSSYDLYFGESVAAWAGRIATSYPGTRAKIYDVRDPNNILVTEFGHSTPGYGCRVRFVSEWIVVSGFGQYGNHNTFGYLNQRQDWVQFYYNGSEITADADYGLFPIFRSAGSLGTDLSMMRRTSAAGEYRYEGNYLNVGSSAHVMSSSAMLVTSNSGTTLWRSQGDTWMQSSVPVPPYFVRRVGDSILCTNPFAPLPELHRFNGEGFTPLGTFPFPPIIPGFTGVGVDGEWALGGELLAIGAPYASPNEQICGAAAGDWHDGMVLIYRRLPNGNFAFVDVIHNPSPTRPVAANGYLCRRDMFGKALAWDGRRLVVGCAGSSQPSGRATIHVFDVKIDCDGNGVHDADEIAAGTKPDVNSNGVPDNCEFPLCPGDVTLNGSVDGVDLAAILGEWGSAGNSRFRTDVNLDGIVNGVDLSYVLSSWGACP